MNAQPKKAIYLLGYAIIFLIVGLTVTFSQVLHQNLMFNEWIVVFLGVGFALASFIFARGPLTKIKCIFITVSGLSGLVLAAGVLLTDSFDGLKLTLLIWAAFNAILFAYDWVLTKSRATLEAAILLSAFVLLTAFLATDLTNVMGFLAAMSFIAGVYLVIAVVDAGSKKKLKEEN